MSMKANKRVAPDRRPLAVPAERERTRWAAARDRGR